MKPTPAKSFLVLSLLRAALVAAIVTITLPAFAQDTFTRVKRAASQSVDRYGDVPLGAVIRTDDRYGHDGLILGPRGWDYWNYLQNPKDYQDPNLWPDKRPTYFLGQLEMPPGTDLTIRGRFPYARYFKIALYRFEHNTFVALGGEDKAGYDIEPDPGSANPFPVGADRTVKNRNYTFHVLAEDAPKDRADRAKNTVYAGKQKTEIQIVFRVYLSDEGYDGCGWGPGNMPSHEGPPFTYEAKLVDGTRLSAEEVVKQFGRPLGSAPPPFRTDPWYEMVNSKKNDPALDPASAPARKDSPWGLFWGMKYTVAGAFMSPEERAKIPLPTEMEGGGDPTTAYNLFSLRVTEAVGIQP